MNLLSNSNSIVTVKRKAINPFKIIKNIIVAITIIVLSTSLINFAYSKFMDEKYKSNNNFARIDGKKIHYNVDGSGKYTVILDSSLGTDMKSTEKLSDLIAKKYDCRVFSYDRGGYSYNESTDMKTLEEQAEDLRMLLKKAGVSGPYVLVGEEYGGLVMGAFANLYKDNVKGMVLINPIEETMLQDKEFMKQYSSQKLKRNFEKISSYIGLDLILDKLNFLDYPVGYNNENFTEDEMKEFRVHRIRPSYTSTYYGELNNIIYFDEEEFNKSIYENGILEDKPLAILATENYKSNQEKLLNLTNNSDESHVFLSKVNEVITLNDVDSSFEAIQYVLDRIKLK